jgi:hypothetical protein
MIAYLAINFKSKTKKWNVNKDMLCVFLNNIGDLRSRDL